MMTTISYRIAGAFRAALAASWLVLAASAPVAADDFDDGFTAYLLGKHDQAFKVWLPLARAGGIEAQFGLGLLFEQGRGVARDIEAAASWYARAAEQGSMRAQTQLGGMYARGDGVAEDWMKAISWWRRAAAQGSMRAQFHLGQAYQFGSGVERDLDTALLWYDESAALGFNPAALLIEEIKRRRQAAAEAEAALASADSGADSQTDSPAGESAPPTASRSASVFHETAGDLEAQGAAPLIALGIGSVRPLEGAHRIYLASYRGIQKASEGWRGIVEANNDLLGGLDAAVAQIDLGRDKGIVYRLQAGPLPGLTDANALCYKLSQRSVPCIAVAP
jgi:hypothetical protein